MHGRRDFLLIITLATAAAATPAFGQGVAPTVGAADKSTASDASIPDFSGSWNHASLNGLELPLSGPGPVRNSSRLRTGENHWPAIGRERLEPPRRAASPRRPA